MAIQSFKRYEKKFLLTNEQYMALMPRLKEYMYLDDHCKDETGYKIANIYFDTAQNEIIKHSISKPYYKEKLRLRTYGTPESENATSFLELKKKIGGIVNKRRVVMPLWQSYEFLETGKHPENASYMQNQVLNEIEYFLSNNDVKPTVYISYDRIATFAKNDHDFRLTFDTNITTRRNDLHLESGSFGTQLLLPDQHLMEVKILSAYPMWLTQILSEQGIFNQTFSKYGKEYKNYCLNNKEADFELAI